MPSRLKHQLHNLFPFVPKYPLYGRKLLPSDWLQVFSRQPLIHYSNSFLLILFSVPFAFIFIFTKIVSASMSIRISVSQWIEIRTLKLIWTVILRRFSSFSWNTKFSTFIARLLSFILLTFTTIPPTFTVFHCCQVVFKNFNIKINPNSIVGIIRAPAKIADYQKNSQFLFSLF